MVINLLREFVTKNATKESINRSSTYFPFLRDHESFKFKFNTFGTQIEPYETTIDLNDIHHIKTKCNCKYSYEGICKHTVASLAELIRLIKNNQIESSLLIKPKTKESLVLFIPHNLGVMDKDALRKMTFNNSRAFFGDVEITSLKKTSIEAIYEDYQDEYYLKLSKEINSTELKLTCTCLQHKNCTHKYKLLELLKDEFSLDYFSPNFEDEIKKDHLISMDLYGKVDFNDAFKLEINPNGVFIEDKVKNIVSDAHLIFQPQTEEERKALAKPFENQDSTHSIGLCIRYTDNDYLGVDSIYGKLNKNKTEISSGIKVIEEINLDEVLTKIDDAEIKLLKILIHIDNEAHKLIYDDLLDKDIFNFTNYIHQHKKELSTIKLFKHEDQDNFNKKHLLPIEITSETVQPILNIKSNDKFHEFEVKLKVSEKLLKLQSKQILLTPLGVVFKNKLFLYKSPQHALAVIKFEETPDFSLINEGQDQLQAKIIEPYSQYFKINYKVLKEKKSANKKLIPIRQVYLSEAEEGNYLVFQPIVKYGEKLVSPLSSEKIWLNKEKMLSLKRDQQLEEEFLKLIQELHPKFNDKIDYFYIEAAEALKSMWIMECIENLKNEGIELLGLNQLKKIKYNLNKPNFSIGLSSGTDWFDMEMNISFGDQKVDLRKLQKSIIKKSNYVELNDGSLGILPEKWIEKYKKYFQFGQIKKDKIEVSNFQFNIIDELYEDLETSPDFLKELYEKKKRISNLKQLKEVDPPKHLIAKLRPYQQEGLNWLVFLHENQLGGCLADDMGLGKTLQSIAFLQFLKNNSKNKLKPHLIIAPTSLIFNWMAELEKFAPKLKALAFIGGNRDEHKSSFDQYDLILTTYGSIVKDIEFHKNQVYSYIILDESQAIKNPLSQRFKAVRLLNCENRLALTGTPIENNTFDLYSQFNFLNPGIFGSIKHFRTNFSDAIDKEQDEDTSALLAKIIHPFLLRRTKPQVATELPSKTEAIIYCEMNKQQRKVYDQFKDYFRQQILDQIENEGVNRSQIYILQGLTKLRQICNSTALADKEKDYGNDSAKLDELVRHLKQKVAKHKVLVFSQFVGMLQLVKERLDEEDIKFEYLDGQTKKREEKVNNFQNNPKVRVFLISLKAGGTGLNLTEADYVYLIDPWWNPAVESQAIDRCYRIGQDKKVMAYRMICKDSIEEKILSLQDKKKIVAAEVIRVDEEKKSFKKKDVERFFGA